MMYRCCECGNLFEEGEQSVWEETHGLDSPPYEKFSGCPVCKGDYEEVHQCKKCGDWHTEDELYEGWCEKCLRGTINYETFFKYCEANKKDKYLDIFVMSEFLGGMDCPDNISLEFHQLMIETYKLRVADAKLLKGHFDFLADCILFIMDDDGSIGRENYADWLNNGVSIFIHNEIHIEHLTFSNFNPMVEVELLKYSLTKISSVHILPPAFGRYP